MRRPMKRTGIVLLGALLGLVAAGCGEVERQTAPVELVATATINQMILDLADPPPTQPLSTVLVRAFVKRLDPLDTRFLDVRLQSYRVSYVRTDGGRLVPAPFTVPINQLVPVGAAAIPLDNFIVFEPLATTRAPFAALLPQNQGIDPETGRRTVGMDVVVEIFGETLAGARVHTTTRFPVEICYGC
jgi:hypothetical protein